ncbi:YjbH domain-containing protein [Thermodesulfobacteriota bacterium]
MYLMVRVIWLFILFFCLSSTSALGAETPLSKPLASLQSFTGIWDMHTARILPDWNLRFKYGQASPYRYYGGALGLFDRLEIHGQFTEIEGIYPFPEFDYGNYKDRNAGARLVLIKEDKIWPQVAIGTYDPGGTSLFPSRYLVFSKMFGNLDLTLGLGQGLLGGESLDDLRRESKGDSFTFLFSGLDRPTKLFGGVEYHYNPKLTFSAEYSSLDYEGMFGEPEARWPINFGLKYQPIKHLTLQGGYMRGEEWMLGLSADFPLEPEGMLPWKKEAPFTSNEKQHWQVHEADNRQLATLLANVLQGDGFYGVEVSVNDEEVWVEYVNTKYLSHAKSMGRVAQILDKLTPERLQTFYINLYDNGQVIQCLKAGRQELQAFMETRLDKQGFFEFASLSLYNSEQQAEFFNNNPKIATYKTKEIWFDWDINLKVRTFLNNKAGFFKHKVFIQPRIYMYPWESGLIAGELEFTLLNQFDEVIFTPLEPEPVRTDSVLYEQQSEVRISMLAFDQHVNLPYNVLGRLSMGLFESAYAGFGAEIFRFFDKGRWGIGLEAEFVRKRDPEDNFKLSDTITKTFDTYYVNLYGQIWPSQGVDAGLKIGQFLGGDVGVSLELRRSFKYFTIGAWYTKTDTDVFTSPKNRNASEKGVFITFPLSIFADHDRRGSLNYVFSSFTRDQGATVRQPSVLYPMNPYQSVLHTESTLEDMRGQ